MALATAGRSDSTVFEGRKKGECNYVFKRILLLCGRAGGTGPIRQLGGGKESKERKNHPHGAVHPSSDDVEGGCRHGCCSVLSFPFPLHRLSVAPSLLQAGPHPDTASAGPVTLGRPLLTSVRNRGEEEKKASQSTVRT